MVQTSPTSYADQPHVPGATAVRIVGILLILLGGLKLVTAINAGVQVAERAINANYLVFNLILSGVIALLTIGAGTLLVRRDHAGRVFGLVICSIALAYQLFGFGSTLAFLYVVAPSPTLSLGMVFWTMNLGSIVLYLVSIIVIARWHPPRLPGY
jgi:hypothetical protein